MSAILVVGHSCLDCIAVADAAPPEDGKLEARRMWSGPGGPAANAAVALVRLGHRVRLVTRIGDDAAGRTVRSALSDAGVDLVLPATPGGTTSLAQIRAVGRDRSVVWKRGDLPPLDAGELPADLEEADLVYVDGHEVAAQTAALRRARWAGRLTVGDLGSLRPGAEDWPGWLDCAVATPRWLAGRFPGAATLGQALDELGGLCPETTLAGVTLGERGGFARRGERRLSWTARKTGVVDTTVAGDAFHAGLADGLLQAMDPQGALDWAATLGASVCRGPGPVGLPRDRDELALWHGRWGRHDAPRPELLEAANGPAQGTATR